MRPDYLLVVRMIAFMLATCLVLLPGCINISPTNTPTPSLTPTPTEGPVIQCTAPLCWEDEVFSCPGKCPGGCGTICATRTPDPNASPIPTFPPLSSICTLPTPEPGQTAPGMALCASASEVHVGGVIQLAAELTGVLHSDYISISGQDVDSPGNFNTRARTGEHFPALYNSGAHLSLVLVQTHDDQILVMLQASSPGQVTIDFRVIPTVPDIRSSITLTVLP